MAGDAHLKPLLATPDPSEGGRLVGRDPRRITPETWRAAGLPMRTPVQAIRAKCLDCCAGQPGEVRRCMALTCPLWPLRMGADPFRGMRAPAENPEQAADFGEATGGADPPAPAQGPTKTGGFGRAAAASGTRHPIRPASRRGGRAVHAHLWPLPPHLPTKGAGSRQERPERLTRSKRAYADGER